MQSTLLRSTFGFLLIPLLLGACALSGQRATTGECPEGEICSDLTPNGVHFLGTQFSDGIINAAFAPTAVGGKQTVTALSGVGIDSPPFAENFDAVTVDPQIAEVDAVTPPSLTLSGVSDGKTLLRLLEPGTDKLFDRVEIKTATIAEVKLYPLEIVYLTDEKSPWALFAGSTQELVVRLTDSTGARLVDETLSVSLDAGTLTQKAWDLVEVSAPSSGELSFQGTAAGLPFAATAPIVSTIDAIKPSPLFSNLTEPESIPLNGEASYCFYAESGGATVAGASWTFTSSAGATVSLQEAMPWTSCINIKGLIEGPATLDIDASGFKASFKLEVKKSAAKSARFVTQPLAAKAGERAGGM